MTTAVARLDNTDPREAALIKAVGWDRVPAEQRELALHICERYGLDPMLRHVVMVEGKPYITRDGLLHVAHRSGVFDGIEVSEPVLGDTHWHARATVYRKDMSRPFAYSGRYPKTGGNQRFAPEMAVKVAEVQTLRRAFDVSAATIEERWDIEDAAIEAAAPRPVASLAEKVAAKRADIEARQPDAPAPSPEPAAGVSPRDDSAPAVAIGAGTDELVMTPAPHEPDGAPASDGVAAAGAGHAAPPSVIDAPALHTAGPEEAAAASPTAAADPDVRPCNRADPVDEERCILPIGHSGKHQGYRGAWK